MQGISFALKVARRCAALALATAAAVTLASAPVWAQDQQQQQQQQQQTQQQAAGLAFSTDAGVVFNVIKADKTADFELVMAKVKEALEKSEDPVRKQQAAGWKLFRAQEPAQNGNVYYLFVLDPVVKDADYTVSKILAEVFPSEVQDLYAKLRDAYVPGGFKLSLQRISEMGK